MFSFFESLVDPFKPATAERPPGNSVIHFIYYFAAQAPLVFLAVLLFGALQAWIEISLFGFIGTVVDLLDGANVDTVFSDHWSTFAWILIFIGVIRVLIMAIGILLLEQTIGPSVFNLIRWQSHKNVVRQSLSYFHNDFAGRIATKVIQAGQAVTDFLITLLDTVWLIILYVISTLILFLDLDWRLTLFLVVWSPTTRYLDYAISEQLFHWESQAKDTVTSDRGQNYLHHEKRGRSIALFIRTSKKQASDRTMPYFCAGTANYVEHQSERPIQITWKLQYPLPGDVFADYRAAVA